MQNDELQHHGIKGMHWGIRRFQNKDGSYTAAGKRRYSTSANLLDNSIASSKAEDQRLLNNRKNYKDFRNSRYEKKIASAKKDDARKKYADKKESFNKDFDKGTEYIKKGQDIYNKTIERCRDVNVKALSDPAFKDTVEYKTAHSDYNKQLLKDFGNALLYGENAREITKLKYAGHLADAEREKRINSSK